MDNLFSKIILGTAQLGMPYGIGQWAKTIMPEKVAFRILDAAWERGFKTLDTSPDYGLAVERIAKFMRHNPNKNFTIITKIKHIPKKFTKQTSLLNCINAQLFGDLPNLDQLHVLIHNENHVGHRMLINELNSAKISGKITSWGGAVYSVGNAKAIVNTPGCSLLNVPINFFNKDFLAEDVLQACKDQGIKVIARSIFARGLFFSSMNSITMDKSFDAQLENIRGIAQTHKLSLSELCVIFAMSDERVGHAVVGFDNASQLNEIDGRTVEANIDRFGVGFWAQFRLPEFDAGKPQNWTFSGGVLSYKK